MCYELNKIEYYTLWMNYYFFIVNIVIIFQVLSSKIKYYIDWKIIVFKIVESHIIFQNFIGYKQ